MSIERLELPEREQKFVRRCVDEGCFESVDAVVLAGLRLLEQRQEDERRKLDRLRAEVQKGMDDLENGRYVEITSDEELDALFDDVKRRAAARRGNKVHDIQAP